MMQANIDILLLGDRSSDLRTSFVRCLESQFFHLDEDDDVILRSDPFRETSELLSRASALRGTATLCSLATR